MVRRELKNILKCKVTIFLLLSWGLLSLAGYLGKDNIYGRYKTDVAKNPYFVLVFQGIHDGIYPWQIGQKKQDFGPGGESAVELVPETETEELSKTQETETEELTKADATEDKETEQTKEFVNVEDDYFDDAVFIGDSRTVGLRDYGGLDHATFYASVGLNVYDMWTEKFCDVDGAKVTLEEALSSRQFGKVYFQIGINEMGRGTLDSFMEAYTASVEKFRQLQPDAVIYVQAIMHVAKAKSDTDPIFNNRGLVERNNRIAQLADQKTIFYIDVNEVVCDADGNLKQELTFDNLHLYGSKYDIWVDFLKTKGIAE